MRLYRDGPLNGMQLLTQIRSAAPLISFPIVCLCYLLWSYSASASQLFTKVCHRSQLGSISSIDVPFDSDHNSCGVKHADHPYIYFASPHSEV